MKTAFVQGFGGLGQGLVETLLEQNQYEHIFIAARNSTPEIQALPPELVTFLEWDFERPETIKNSTQKISNTNCDLQLVINSQGTLKSSESHSSFISLSPNKRQTLIEPERRIESLSPENMLHLYYVNSVIPLLTFQALWPFFRKSSFVWLVNISAKVGSIGDNRLGGWYSYRSSKAALNMLTKTLALELAQRRINGGILAIHPGTVATKLSTPFSSPKSDTRLSPTKSASAILKVIGERSQSDSGTFWSWDGNELPW